MGGVDRGDRAARLVAGEAQPMKRLLGALVAVLILAISSGCVVASPDADTYRDAAASNLGTAASEVATVQMMLELLDKHRITTSAVVAQLRYSEKNLATAAQGLTGLNPPASEDAVSTKAGKLFDQAESLVDEARVAVHRSKTTDYPQIAKALKTLGSDLQDLESSVS
jgi:cytochrome c556